MGDRRIAGCCAFCDNPVQEVIRMWPEDDPRFGEPRLLGKVMPDAVKVTIILAVSGNHSSLTRCATCPTPDAEALRDAWRRAIRLNARSLNPDFRAAADMDALTPTQEDRSEMSLVLQLHDLPIGVLCEQTWEEVNRGHA